MSKVKSKSLTVKLEDDKSVNIRCIPVSTEIRLESQREYSKAFSYALDQDLPIKAEYERIVRRKGLMNLDQEEEQIEKVRKELKDMEIRLWSARRPDGKKMTKDEGRELALEMKRKRNSMGEITSSISEIFSHTAEQYASNEQLQYLLYACTINEDSGERYWSSFEAFKSDEDSKVTAAVMPALISMFANVDEGYEKKFPENSWLIKMGFMDQELHLIDNQGRLIDEEGRLINKDGRYIDEDGDFVDEFGNKVDEDGNVILVDGWAE